MRSWPRIALCAAALVPFLLEHHWQPPQRVEQVEEGLEIDISDRRLSSNNHDLFLVLDFTVPLPQRLELIAFAVQLVRQVARHANHATSLSLSFGVVVFHEDVSYEVALNPDYIHVQDQLLHPDFGNWGNATGGLSRKTGEALEFCGDLIEVREDHAVLVVLTNGLSANASQTVLMARELHDQEAVLYAIGLDDPSTRSADRTWELLEMATDYWPVDAFFNRSNSTNLTEMMNLNFTNLSHWNSWNLTNLTYDNASNWTEYAGPPMPLMELAHLLAPDIIAYFEMLTPHGPAAPSGPPGPSVTTSSAGGLSTTEAIVEPGPEPPEGLGAGIIVVLVLGIMCCLGSVIGVVYYLWERRQKASVKPSPGHAAPSPVVPTAGPPDRSPRPPPPKGPRPMDETQQALSDAIEAQELTRLRALLGEILLKGWPKRRYSDLVLKGLDTVAKLKPSAAMRLEEALIHPETGLDTRLADARLAGVDPTLLRRAEELRQRRQNRTGNA
ncbi:unnamed protein product [Durusdinium trenchii]|uniref:VWFA domain-containing protein n=1 Tax=Durusdinium trenchii TaxID=1381693 RepID=A0ABP0ML32_9DINO